jgi:hypothetical protein
VTQQTRASSHSQAWPDGRTGDDLTTSAATTPVITRPATMSKMRPSRILGTTVPPMALYAVIGSAEQLRNENHADSAHNRYRAPQARRIGFHGEISLKQAS